jgi:hypothetical protein
MKDKGILSAKSHGKRPPWKGNIFRDLDWLALLFCRRLWPGRPACWKRCQKCCDRKRNEKVDSNHAVRHSTAMRVSLWPVNKKDDRTRTLDPASLRLKFQAANSWQPHELSLCRPVSCVAHTGIPRTLGSSRLVHRNGRPASTPTALRDR